MLGRLGKYCYWALILPVPLITPASTPVTKNQPHLGSSSINYGHYRLSLHRGEKETVSDHCASGSDISDVFRDEKQCWIPHRGTLVTTTVAGPRGSGHTRDNRRSSHVAPNPPSICSQNSFCRGRLQLSWQVPPVSRTERKLENAKVVAENEIARVPDDCWSDSLEPPRRS